eukprot:TRINITY_DN1661_c0_g1_i3.p1 TRINITY_DN1661_c0_g1~~TRINITY_DN1661_c0_g1_i3.p1  ORF type:complete len:358 (+),score=93.26 TRINITY_DN1661_c0_g1_i3:64-1137(+)
MGRREGDIGGTGPAPRFNNRDGGNKKGGAGRGGNNNAGRGNQRHNNKWGNSRDRKDDAWGGGGAWGAPIPEPEAPQLNTDPEPIYYDDYSQTYPVDQISVKVAEALRALRANEVDAMTKPILDKWEAKVKMALKMKTALPEPPNWKAPARAVSAGWGAGGGGLDNNAFLAQASQGKKKGKPSQKKNQPIHEDPMQESRIQDIWRTQQSIQEHQMKITAAQERMHNLTSTLSNQLRESDQLLKGIAKMLQGANEETRTEIRTDFAQQLQAQQQQAQQQQQQQQAQQQVQQQVAAQQAQQQQQQQVQMAPQQIYQPLVDQQHMQMPGLAPGGQTTSTPSWGMGTQFAPGGMFSGMQKKS